MCYCVKGHDNATPSLSIDIVRGRFYCFGCELKGGNWNSLAKIIGAEELKDGEGPDPFYTMNYTLKQELEKLNGDMDEANNCLPWDLEPWTGPWKRPRGIEISQYTLNAANAFRFYDDMDRCYRILFPVYVYGDLSGWVARRLDKEKERKYRNSPKFKAKKLLFPLDIVDQMKTRSVALVEGPADALWLLDNDIPALCTFGTKNWSKKKAVDLINLGIKRVVIAGDGDAAGEQFRVVVGQDLSELFEVVHFRPPVKRDPGDLKGKGLRKLGRLVGK